MSDDILFEVAPENGSISRLVIARTSDGRTFTDRFDVHRAGHRKRFAEEIAKTFGLDVESILERVNSGLPRLAERADAEAETMAAAQAAENRAFRVDDLEPWPEPVTLREVLEEALAAITRYIFIAKESAIACTLWTAWTHIFDVFDVAPLLVLKSPVKRCGKTTTLSVLSRFVARPLAASNITPAAWYRIIESQKPILLVDEADTWLASDEELRGIINSGHTKDTAFVVRVNPDSLEPERFSTWCPKLIAGIGDLPGTIEDRAVIIRLERKPSDVKLPRLGRKTKEELRIIGRKYARWARDHEAEIDGDADPPDIPKGLNDRAADNWRPLLILAEHAGGDWPDLARKAAATLSGEDDLDAAEVGIRLLATIHELLPTLGSGDIVSTKELLDALHGLQEWSHFGRNGRPISPHMLAKILRPFGIKATRTMYERGYRREDFGRAFRNYLQVSWPQASYASSCDVSYELKNTYGNGTKRHAKDLSDSKRHIVILDGNTPYDVYDTYDASQPPGMERNDNGPWEDESTFEI